MSGRLERVMYVELLESLLERAGKIVGAEVLGVNARSLELFNYLLRHLPSRPVYSSLFGEALSIIPPEAQRASRHLTSRFLLSHNLRTNLSISRSGDRHSTSTMAEPRMRMRQKGQQFPTADCTPPSFFPLDIPSGERTNERTNMVFLPETPVEAYLVAFGDDRQPLPETVKILDEMITDFIIETCHEAAAAASHSRRAKIKVDDFKFMLRHDPNKLGRVQELMALQKEMQERRRIFNEDGGLENDAMVQEVAHDEVNAGTAAAAAGDGGGGGAGATSGRGKKKKAQKAKSQVNGDDEDD